MNRRGDVPMILLFLVALVLSLIALYIFLSFRNDSLSVSKEMSNVLQETEENKQIILFESVYIANVAINCSDCKSSDYRERYKEIAWRREENALKTVGIGNFFGKIRNSDFVFEKRGEDYILEVKGLIVGDRDKSDYNRIDRKFDIYYRFDDNGGLKGIS